VYAYGIQAFALAIAMHRTASWLSMIAVSGADCGFDAGCLLT
jgi:hypothetical protein